MLKLYPDFGSLKETGHALTSDLQSFYLFVLFFLVVFNMCYAIIPPKTVIVTEKSLVVTGFSALWIAWLPVRHAVKNAFTTQDSGKKCSHSKVSL